MKLFVVGENSPNPDDWSPWGSLDIVVAANEEEARSLAGEDKCAMVAEIPLDRPLHVICRGSSDPEF